jgi:hypothetical protein
MTPEEKKAYHIGDRTKVNAMNDMCTSKIMICDRAFECAYGACDHRIPHAIWWEWEPEFATELDCECLVEPCEEGALCHFMETI